MCSMLLADMLLQTAEIRKHHDITIHNLIVTAAFLISFGRLRLLRQVYIAEFLRVI